jgi:hypothetical protein
MTKVWVAPCPVCNDFTLWADKTTVDFHSSIIWGCLFCGSWRYPPDAEPNTPSPNIPVPPKTTFGNEVEVPKQDVKSVEDKVKIPQ